MVKLTAQFVHSIQPDPDKEHFFWDSELHGFGLRVKPSGRKAFFIQYRNVDGRTRRLTLGKADMLSAAQVRLKAAHLLSSVHLDHTDPSAERKLNRQSVSLEQLAEKYFNEYARLFKKARSCDEDERLFKKYIKARIGQHRVKNISTQEIRKLHAQLRDTPVQANRVLALLSKMFNLAEEWGERAEGTNPCRRIPKFQEKSCERYLSPEELNRIGKTLKQIEDDKSEPQVAIDAIRLLILTGARKNEILNLKWSEVDVEAGLLRLEDSKTGAKIIYLNMAAIDILKKIKRDPVWVIPSDRRENQSFSGLGKIWMRVREKAEIPDVRIHDLRHSFASVAAGLGEGLLMIGKLLGHTQASTTQRYAHLADNPIRTANERIGRAIDEALNSDGARVIDLQHEQQKEASNG